ncbi:TetR/AcrR family transcriptional regulator [Marinobacter halodurans]|uniref:TetR/AcrR family transcriptional regulator n=1 Tax=Marinobacter halodurans TaxID=2528979 RepID=A0ABY1ZHZ8_9GAMM|nr:TetR/AcrR family transcriptional regulator [Marinobacter halodurans]TBW52907.1 TetR/AcrR family transcriptional regulator [Marinobacter halodurans]
MSNLQERREREKQQRQDAILDAAETMFAGKGYERTSMDEIARTASLSRALLYVYFKDKAAIQRGIILRAAERLQERFRTALEAGDTGLDKIREIGAAYYRFWQEEPNYFDALTRAATAMQDADADESELMVGCEMTTMSLMVEALNAGIEDGSIDATQVSDCFQTALYLRGALHGVIMMCQQEMGEDGPLATYPSDSLVRHTMEMLVRSIRA